MPNRCEPGILPFSDHSTPATACDGKTDETCNFQCDDGYQSDGVYTCGANGRWSGASCQRVDQCETTLANDRGPGVRVTYNARSNTAEAHCREGYKPTDEYDPYVSSSSSPSFAFQCINTNWQLLNSVGGETDTHQFKSQSLCQPSTCAALSVAHGVWGLRSNGTLGQKPCATSHYCATAGAIAVAVCDEGFELDTVLNTSREQVCNDDGQWTPGVVGECRPVPVAASCDAPDVKNAHIDRVSDSLVMLRCNADWHFDGNYGIDDPLTEPNGDEHTHNMNNCVLPQCLYLSCDDGLWSPSVPTCVELAR